MAGNGSRHGTDVSCLQGLLNDAFLGLIKAGSRLPSGVPLAEDIIREMARTTAQRCLSKNGPGKPIESLLEAAQYYCSDEYSCGILGCTGTTVEETSNRRVRVIREGTDCIFRPQCAKLAVEGYPRICPRRLYAEQAMAAVMGRGVGSIVLPGSEDNVCTFETFMVSDAMLTPIERAVRNFSNIQQEREQAKDHLSRLAAQHRLILETMADAIVVVDNDARVTYMNGRACGAFATRLQEAVGHPLEKYSVFGRLGDLVLDAAGDVTKHTGIETVENVENGNLHNIYLVQFSPVVEGDESRIGTLIVLHDVTREEILRRQLALQARNLEKTVDEKTLQLKTANAKLALLARTDSLTGLANRRSFEEALESELDRGKRYEHPTGVLCIDVDRFKQVNDIFGHGTGDEVLKRVAAVLVKSVRTTDKVSRWGGDEFSILLPEAGLKECLAVARRIEENTRIENDSEDHVSGVTMSLSVGWASGVATDAEGLLARADEMMYDHKSARKAREDSNVTGRV